jgi:hypothetical protein
MWLVLLLLTVCVLVWLFMDQRKCTCGHDEGDHIGEIQLEGPEPHPGVCLGSDFRCPCMEFEKKD